MSFALVFSLRLFGDSPASGDLIVINRELRIDVGDFVAELSDVTDVTIGLKSDVDFESGGDFNFALRRALANV